jgi:hypothetical protein
MKRLLILATLFVSIKIESAEPHHHYSLEDYPRIVTVCVCVGCYLGVAAVCEFCDCCKDRAARSPRRLQPSRSLQQREISPSRLIMSRDEKKTDGSHLKQQ